MTVECVLTGARTDLKEPSKGKCACLGASAVQYTMPKRWVISKKVYSNFCLTQLAVLSCLTWCSCVRCFPHCRYPACHQVTSSSLIFSVCVSVEGELFVLCSASVGWTDQLVISPSPL